MNQFYKTKEGEFLERGEMLNRQLEMLVDLKQILTDRKRNKISDNNNLARSWSSSSRNSDVSGQLYILQNFII